ncbi:Putative transcriptional regulator, GntR family [Mycobacteroides abscessus subsp. abscessus]|nr:Putative transcriptional regulator, GntR family [Mycobacteroides abscessus subsp. abscessus]
MPVPPSEGIAARSLLRDNAYKALRTAIVDGTLAPGERLRDDELSRWLGVSRTPIREALARLEQAGLVQTQPGRHTIVSPIDVREAADAERIGATDPLTAFTHLAAADAQLDKLLATAQEERAAAERRARVLDQALVTARQRLDAVNQYIGLHRGAVGARTRWNLDEAQRRLAAAEQSRASNPSDAILFANGAAELATQAQYSAQQEVQSAQRYYSNGYGGGYSVAGDVAGNVAGAVIGGILRGMLSGGSGHHSSWSGSGSSSYGGSSRSSGSSFRGGGGRF